MYNDIWFLDKLQYLNPETKLYTPTNYKSLYQKYLEQGTIYDNFGNEYGVGIKINLFEGNYYILKFNGELICDKLIDTNVIDIYANSYIKLYEWFIIKDNKSVKLDIVPKFPFLKVLMIDNIVFALTNEGVYYYQYNNIKLFLIEDAIDMHLSFSLYVLDKLGNTYCLDDIGTKLLHKLENNKVKIKQNVGLFVDNKIISLCCSFFDGVNIDELKTFFCHEDYFMILSKNSTLNIYQRNNDNKYILHENKNNILNIYPSQYVWFHIKK